MLYREIIAVCSQIHTKHTNTLCGQNVDLLNVKLSVNVVTVCLWKVKTWDQVSTESDCLWSSGKNVTLVMFIEMLLANDDRKLLSLQTSRLAQLRIVGRNIKCGLTRLPPGLRALACCDSGFESSPGACLSVCCKCRVLWSTVLCTHRPFVYRSGTECVYVHVSLSVIVCSNNSVHNNSVHIQRGGRRGQTKKEWQNYKCKSNRLHLIN